MSCPSVFELARFIEGDGESAQFELHVSSCEACASRLSTLAARAMDARGLTRQLEAPRASSSWFAVLALAATVVMIGSAPALAGGTSSSRLPEWSPEDAHGVVEPVSERVKPREDVLVADAGLRVVGSN